MNFSTRFVSESFDLEFPFSLPALNSENVRLLQISEQAWSGGFLQILKQPEKISAFSVFFQIFDSSFIISG